ncbi:TlpA family protein disulfide reductase [Desulfofundulus thermocisternus]|uniref:TlpA family protein disulfide reductase n=1 Tax=Desulfofundulus thermocisternus TaxID=42471 RepID=UPI00217DE464|nr:TlpA disulfide reductase family protein [Desulfofundulus thermocisternus]MCS5695131.1 TlpA family protein disulfide reductase [Desulfofundulus thermocisternus]
MKKRLFSVVILSLVVISLIAVYAYFRPGAMEGSGMPPDPTGSKESGVAVGMDVGQRAPDFTLTTADGEELSLSDFRGRPVVLNFWATWCPPCRAEMPAIQSFYEKTGREIHVLAVNLTASERSAARVKDFLDAGGFTFPVLLDTRGDVAREYLVRAIPTTFFIDREGIIRARHTGSLTLEMLEEIVKEKF